MIRVLSAAVAWLAMAMPALADDLKPFEGPKPIAVMMTTNPWLMVIGSDTPNFVLYEDGQVVYLQVQPDRTGVYMTKRLAPGDMIAFKARLAALVPGVAPKKNIDLRPGLSDQPLSRFYVDIDGKHLVTSVYGLSRKGLDRADEPFDLADWLFGPIPDYLPVQVASLNALLSGWSVAGATVWQPKFIEAMVWDYDHAPAPSVQWPSDWPGLTHPSTLKRSTGYSIFLPGAQLPRLTAFLKTQNEMGAVEIDGKKCTVSVRYAFPGEKTWSAAFRETE